MEGKCCGRLGKVLGIREIELHEQVVTGADRTIDVVVDIFNRVHSGGGPGGRRPPSGNSLSTRQSQPLSADQRPAGGSASGSSARAMR